MDRQTLMNWRPALADVPMGLWCLWPLFQWPWVEDPDPQPWISFLYLSAAWGLPWLLGRIYFSGPHGKQLIASMVAGLALIAPIALIEGIEGPKFYQWFYGLHPFRFDGVQRYVGFRPLGFFEDGNQYGIWVAAIALAAVWLWRTSAESRWRGLLLAAAILSIAIALLSQSLGAVVLLSVALVLSFTIQRSLTRWTFGAVLLVIAAGGTTYLSGRLPLRAFAEKTAIGRQLVGTIRASGRQSFIWRIARDQNALPLIGTHPLVGAGRWDWWRKNNERPWGLVFLLLGQFGLIGLIFAFGAILTPALLVIAIERPAGAFGMDTAAPLTAIILMAVADALLNSFLFYPVILFAGALAPGQKALPPLAPNCAQAPP
jgi:hypothetical protein